MTALLAVACESAVAQRRAAAVSFSGPGVWAPDIARPADSASGQVPGIAQPGVRARQTAWAVLASAAVPGLGQAMLEQNRFVAYLAFETYAWARYTANRRSGMIQRDRYRMLARRVAREIFESSPRDGDFEYYERMEHFVESGVFDRIAGGDVDPEVDTTTYNGATWLLARETFWEDANNPPDRTSREWRLAEEFYRNRAVGPAYRWSWRNALLEYDDFRRTIRRSNDGFRRSLEDLGVIIANHALSTVDAFVTVRVRQHSAAALAPGTGRYSVVLSVPFDGPR